MSSAARLAWCVLAALAVFLAWLIVGAGAQVGLAFLYAIPITMATWWFGWRAGSAAALACIALYVLSAEIHPVSHFGLALAIRSLTFFAIVAIVATIKDRIATLEHSAEELEAIRLALAPPSMPDLPGVDVAAAFVPSELGVSGDFYLVTNGPDGSTIAVVGDVVGHGPKAAQLATFIRARLAVFAANSSDPAEILTLANSALGERGGRRPELVSAVCLRFVAGDATLAWAAAGHPPPLRLPDLQSLPPRGLTFLLGAKADLALTTAEVTLSRTDGVLVYTDGATDLRQGKEGMLGLEGLQRLLAPLANLPARDLVRELENALVAWAGGPVRDDLCVLALKPRDD